MRPVKVERENSVFTKPQGWDEERDGRCGELSIRKENHGPNRVYHFSNWRPDSEDLAILNAGGVIELCCVGVQPPVSINVVEGVEP